MDWEKANRRERAQPAKPDTRKQQMQRQTALADFVAKHDVSCFKCGRSDGPWAKTGVSRRGPWAICVECVGEGV
jgi:hypothetical protein